MNKKIDRFLWIGSLLCLSTLVFGLANYNKMPESVAIHFDSGGNPNGYAGKGFVIFAFPILMALLHIIVYISLTKEAVKDSAAKALVAIGKISIPIAVVIIQPLIIMHSFKEDVPVNTVVTIMVGLIFVLSGNYFPKNRVNPHVGMKFPWLLHNEEGWRKTHKLSGYLWIAAGFIMILTSFIRVPFIAIFAVIISLTALVPIIYSLCLCKVK